MFDFSGTAQPQAKACSHIASELDARGPEGLTHRGCSGNEYQNLSTANRYPKCSFQLGFPKLWSPWLQDSSLLTDFVLWVGSTLAEEARRASGAPRSHNHPGARCDEFVPELLNQLLSNAQLHHSPRNILCGSYLCLLS